MWKRQPQTVEIQPQRRRNSNLRGSLPLRSISFFPFSFFFFLSRFFERNYYIPKMELIITRKKKGKEKIENDSRFNNTLPYFLNSFNDFLHIYSNNYIEKKFISSTIN